MPLLVQALQRHQIAANFSPDSTRIAGASINNRVSLWASTTDSATQQICGEVGTPITPVQWKIYLPDQAYAPPCAAGP
ncbi:hypothetical protein ABIB25_001918 [Nakamurella sp. UYEF19]|uniref:hypothetical protein n=1 Tax=Nakamurella sp. UYEF19 TaxID=1756392 RepID=UPI00339AD5B0